MAMELADALPPAADGDPAVPCEGHCGDSGSATNPTSVIPCAFIAATTRTTVP